MFHLAWFQFLLRYRRTALGPLWLLVGPALFVATLGLLFAQIGAVAPEVFIPHLAIGYVTWTLLSGFVVGSATVYQRGRAQILQGGQSLDDIVAVDVIITVLSFLHQTLIIAAVFLIYGLPLSWGAPLSLVGLALLVVNGIWVGRVFGILGARYRDLAEVFQAVMRIAMLATPIIWMPGDGGHRGIMGAFLMFNPFFHFLELVRAPLLGQPIAPMSWAVVISITLVGFAVARLMSARYARFVPLWV